MPQPNRLQVLYAPDKSGQGFGLDWLVHGFSTRSGGQTKVFGPEPGTAIDRMDLNLGFVPADDPETVARNRRLFLQAVWRSPGAPSLATLRQIHSSLIRTVEQGGEPAASAVLPGDGMVTGSPNVLLGIQTADCLPVLLADRKNRVVGAFHAGWRGTLARIVEKGVGRMRMEFGSRPKDLVAAIGPGIGACCYAVGEDLRDQFLSQFSYSQKLFREVADSNPVKDKYPLLFLTARAPGHSNIGPSLHLDLAEANRRQLLDSGLTPGSIHSMQLCTACQTKRFFSHRKENGFTGRMMSVIGVRG